MAKGEKAMSAVFICIVCRIVIAEKCVPLAIPLEKMHEFNLMSVTGVSVILRLFCFLCFIM